MNKYDDDDSNTFFDIPRPADGPKNPTPDISDTQYKHSIVDSKKTPIETITSFIGGSNWTVDYYSQILTSSEELKPFDPIQLNVYQTYTKINRLVIKLQGSLNNEDDKGSGRFNMTGTAIITPMPNLIPNVGDPFIADIGEGSAGQFTITDIRQLTNNMATAYEVQFKLDRLVTKELETKLAAKVTRELWYRKDYLLTGQDALLTTEDYNNINELEKSLVSLSGRYISKFYNHEVNTLVMPNQSELTYDPFVVNIAMQIVEIDDRRMRHLKKYNCDDWRIPHLMDVYTAVYRQDPSLLYECFSGYALLDTSHITVSTYQNSIKYSAIRKLIVPLPKQDYVNNYTDLIYLIGNGTSDGISTSSVHVKTPLDNMVGEYADPCCEVNEVTLSSTVTESDANQKGMDIPAVDGTSYVMSEAFFERAPVKVSAFERAIYDVIDRKKLNASEVLDYVKFFPKWSPLQQYYLGPLLILLIRATLRGV